MVPEQIRGEEDFNCLAKKLAQKIYAKERGRGTEEMNQKNAKRAKAYIEEYFSKYKTYQHQPNH
jgi:deoxyadenosine/deoxycytidine kinase